MNAFAARANANTIPIVPLTRRGYKAWLEKQPATTKNWVSAQGFKPTPGRHLVIPRRDGTRSCVVVGIAGPTDMWSFGGLPSSLPLGRYAIRGTLEPDQANQAAVAWGLGHYRFERYRKAKRSRPTLVWPQGSDPDLAQATVDAICLGRDLVNTPANDMGPADLATAAKELASRHEAKCRVLKGKALLEGGYPTVHAVGRASSTPPHYVDLRWGKPKHKKLTLVGKGVCFDSGGLDLKSAGGMKLMKKDMGGAASVLALAHMIMSTGVQVRLRVLIPAVENSVSGNAYRPLDVLKTRKGLTVEIGNTDAEGRLVLCDALAEAVEEKPDLLIDFATLTGAARVALGAELPALFSTDDAVADAILTAGTERSDPLWRMPLHQPYRRHLDSDVADLNNISSVGPGGAITAALFLQEFVGKTRWVHIDTMAYNSSSQAGRPKGGEIFGARAMYEMIRGRYGVQG